MKSKPIPISAFQKQIKESICGVAQPTLRAELPATEASVVANCSLNSTAVWRQGLSLSDLKSVPVNRGLFSPSLLALSRCSAAMGVI